MAKEGLSPVGDFAAPVYDISNDITSLGLGKEARMTEGFIPPRTTALLEFDDGEYKGCEVRCAFDLSFDDYFYFEEFLRAEKRDKDFVEKVFRRFGDEFLESWNILSKKGEALPPTGDGMMGVSVPVGMLLLMSWIAAMVEARGVSAPLGETSPNGATSPAAAAKTGRKSQRRAKSRRRSS